MSDNQPRQKQPVRHPQWECPRCGTVMFFFGATSHMNRCWPGWERWREQVERTSGEAETDDAAETIPPDVTEADE